MDRSSSRFSWSASLPSAGLVAVTQSPTGVIAQVRVLLPLLVSLGRVHLGLLDVALIACLVHPTVADA